MARVPAVWYTVCVMPFLRDLMTKVKTLASALADFFGGLAERLVHSAIGEKFRDFAQGALEKIPEAKRRPFLIGIGGGFALALLASAGIALLMERPETTVPPSAERLPARRVTIPPEELFLPDEPDFVPGVLLERERRTVWTVEDAAPYWRDPLQNGEEQWRNRLEAAVDELLERVP